MKWTWKWTKVTPASGLSDEVYALKMNAETARTKRAALLQHCRMASQKSCKRAGCSSSKFWLFNAAVESPLTAINSAVAAVQKIPESRSALQSSCKVALKRQRMLLPVMA